MEGSSKTELLSESVITFDPASSVDEFGRVFWRDGQVYRGVARQSEALARDILERASVWSAYGLIETSESNFRMRDFPLVLAHRTIRFRSYCTEWIPEMLRDAALTYLRLQLKLTEDGYMLKDGHPWNILFDAGRPAYVDVGSIIPFNEDRVFASLREFRLYFLLPLKLFSLWSSKRVYEFLNTPIPNQAAWERTANEESVKALPITKLFGHRFTLKRLISQVERLNVSHGDRTEWTAYEQKAPDVTAPDSFLAKQRSAYEVLKRLGSGTLLDIGCNKGWYSRLAETMGFSVVSVDIDLASLATLYSQVKREQLNILPLRVDICDPTGANGLDEGYPAFIDRMKCDVVLAMAIIHHLAYKRAVSFETTADRIAKLTRRVAVVEFIPREDAHVCKWEQNGMEWYSRARLIKAFMLHFDRVESFPSTPHPREVFVFEKKGV